MKFTLTGDQLSTALVVGGVLSRAGVAVEALEQAPDGALMLTDSRGESQLIAADGALITTRGVVTP